MSDQLAEALRIHDDGDPIYPDTLDVLINAARKWSWLTVTCETCGGNGKIEFTRVVARRKFPDDRPCPDCTDGRRVNPEAVEVLDKIIDSNVFEIAEGLTAYEIAEAGLRAVIEAAGREEE